MVESESGKRDETENPSDIREAKDVGSAPDVEELEQHRVPATPKQKRTASELAEMIRQDLGKVEGCPKHGVNVTVYGLNPWNAMLMFDANAGAVAQVDELREFFDVITDRLKRLYDISG